MAIDPVVPRSRRNVLVAAAAGLAGLLASKFAEPDEAKATTGTMVYGTVMDEGVDTTTLTSSGAFTAVFQNSGSGVPIQGFASGGQAGVLGANSPGGNGVLGESPKGNGVQGLSTSGTGVNGISTSGPGMIGTSTSQIGVIGGSSATDQPGLYGQSTGNNTGVIGFSGVNFFSFPPSSPARTGVYGYVAQDSTAVGVKGESIGGTGTAGLSTSGTGVQGSSTSGDGVAGASSSAHGVLGTSLSGNGVAAVSGAIDQAGVLGFSNSNNTGVFGLSHTGLGLGLFPVPPTPNETGVYGYAAQSAAAAGVKGESTSGTGVSGQATTGVGVSGQSGNGNGVHGDSGFGYGVYGTSSQSSGVVGSSTAPNVPAILGLSPGNNTGVLGYSGTGFPPRVPLAPTGVYGYASAIGVKGESTTGSGVEAVATTGAALAAVSGTGPGVVARSSGTAAVIGYIGVASPSAPASGAAVFGAGPIGGYDLYAGGYGRVGFIQGPDVGTPGSPFVSATGDLFVDAAGSMWVCVAGGSPGSFRKLAGTTSAGTLHAINPARVYDSRLSDGPLAVGGVRTISLSTATVGGTVVPSGALAIAYNLTITGTLVAGWLGVVPAGASFGGTSSINWFAPAQTLANGGIVKLGGDRQCDIWSGGRAGASTQFIVDITGYYA